MPEFHYLISSLPMLRWEEPPPISTGEFIEACATWLSDFDMDLLRSAALIPAGGDAGRDNRTLVGWNDWEIQLRNALARQRGGDLGREAEPFLRPERDGFSDVENGLQEARGTDDPLERERVLDSLRWRRLEDLESGHLFDFDHLVVYKLKLGLLEKIEARDKGKGERNLATILEKTSLS